MAAMTEETTVLTKLELGLTGKNNVSLTEWGTTSEPAMAEGSILELGSAIFEAVGGDLDVGDLAALADGIIYLYCADDGTLSASVTAPTWNDDLAGWYDGTSRCYASLLKAGAIYSHKYIWTSRDHDFSVGLVCAFAVSIAPGWIRCQGQTISYVTNPEYGKLISLLKKEAGADAAHPYYHADADKCVLPDIDGRIIRGIDNISAARDKDGVRKSGSYQADDNKLHNHNLNFYQAAGASQVINNTTILSGTPIGFSTLIVNQGSAEATMKNIALYYMIRY